MYLNGLGVSKDVVVAHLWFSLATDQGDEEAAMNLDMVEGQMSEDQIAEARGLLRAWKGREGS
jgi:TPR repeat protein